MFFMHDNFICQCLNFFVSVFLNKFVLNDFQAVSWH